MHIGWQSRQGPRCFFVTKEGQACGNTRFGKPRCDQPSPLPLHRIGEPNKNPPTKLADSYACAGGTLQMSTDAPRY